MADQQKQYGVPVTDYLRTFEAGVNAGVSPDLLKNNQLANATNTTVRGDYVSVRPYFRKMYLDYRGNDALKTTVEKSLFQEAQYYQPDNGDQSLLAALSGNLIQFVIGSDRATVVDVTGGNPQSTTQTKHWMWQSEKWMIWNDSVNVPVFFDGNITTVSNSTTSNVAHTAQTTTAVYQIGSVNSTGPADINLGGVENPPGSVATIKVGDVLTFQSFGQLTVTAVTGATTFTLLNTDPTWAGLKIPIGGGVSWNQLVTTPQLPPGRMGSYGMGRNWVCLPDGKQFVASDLVGGSSGTIGNNFRDSVLFVTENTYLAGGGNFAIPGSYGEITAMIFCATLDASLGQGPLQVFTQDKVFSCQTPLDRLTWQNVTSPILTESLIAGGSLSQDATVTVNGDTIFRGIDGLRSLILARREFDTWGNTPISLEVDPALSNDSENVIRFASAVVFDNRLLVTTGGVPFSKGVYWRGIVPLNFDSVSTLRGKQPAVYDSVVWQGLNVLKLVTGIFGSQKRCFAFTYNLYTDSIELWEILKTVRTELGAVPDVTTDSGGSRVTWRIESATLLNKDQKHPYLQLKNGEIYVDEMIGTVDFEVWYRPDQWPCWIPWSKWSECAGKDSTSSQPQFRPRMGIGEPSIIPCDPTTNRPFCQFYDCQIAITITGHCTFKGGKFFAVTIPEPPPQPTCFSICQP